mmetsp:Transcript_38178/g.48666  ORF Transcript_38178/g.48666 Transcript_38178/m.48666 type:complete len:206 (+) Transcript_38178:95-712(+)
MDTSSNLNGEVNSQSRKMHGRKHLLHNCWTLWFDNPKLKKSNQSWEDNLKQLCDFRTVEDFWSLYNNIQPASRLSVQSTYHLFKKGVTPMWEDENNVNGGKWLITLTRHQRDKIDETWLYTVLAVIGETLDETGDVMGCVVSLRKSHDRIALWTKTSCDAQVQLTIGQRLRVALNLPNTVTLCYQSHQEAARSSSSFKTKVLYEA